MFMFEAVVLKGVRECQPSEVIENMAAVGLASGGAEPIRRRPGYPGCRHFNENYIGSWLAEAVAKSEVR